MKALAAAFLLCATGLAADESFKAPDSIVLKDGRTIRGLIINNTASTIVMQEEFNENTYPKNGIVRILDEADTAALFTDAHRKGDLPPWRVIANDLRTNDAIKSLVEIPATMIDNGEFKNVPYKSFRVNRDIELNIYGDPKDPAGLELGIYGSRSGDHKLRCKLRSYLAGFLSTRKELAALYALDLNGGIQQAGGTTLEITPKSAPDAYGAWWISLYNRKTLADVRLDDAEYAELTMPMEKVLDKRGRVIASGWGQDDLEQCKHGDIAKKNGPVLLRGFCRDAKGAFHLVKTANP